jgi:hypothetical protein
MAPWLRTTEIRAERSLMRRTFAIALAASTALALLAVGSGQAAPTAPRGTLNGSVGPGFTISLKRGASNVTTIKRGQWRLAVRDRSSIHNFHLTGPGVNRSTSVGATGTRSFLVNLGPGRYTFVCDPHASTMRGSFRVTR